MKNKQKRYSKEFKEEAVKLSKELGFTKASEDLGIHHTTIRKWAEGGDLKEARASKSKDELENEVRRPKKE